MIWSEYVPDLLSLRVYSKRSDPLEVQVRGHKIVSGDTVLLHLPLDMDVDKVVIGGAAFLDESTQSVTVRVPHFIPPEFLQSVTRQSSLVEDWTGIKQLHCFACTAPVLDVSEYSVCLTPSPTWGFEDMRVCEECGPMVAGGHVHKKSKWNQIFVSDNSIYVQGIEQTICADCGVDISCEFAPGEAESIRQRTGVPESVSIEKIPKTKIIKGYQNYVSGIIVPDDGKRKLVVMSGDHSVYLTFLTGDRDVIVGMNGEYSWATRVILNGSKRGDFDEIRIEKESFETLSDSINRFALKTGTSRSMSLFPLPPIIQEL